MLTPTCAGSPSSSTGRPRSSASSSATSLRPRPRAAAVEAGQGDEELVAAEPGDEVGAPQPGDQPLRGRDQHLVAGRVAVPVVDRLEAVEVEEQQGEAVLGSRASHSAASSRSSTRRRLGSPVSGSV